MLNEVTDNAIIKVVHLHPRYALARGDDKLHGAGPRQVSNGLTRTRPPFTHPTKDHQKAL